MEKFIDNEENSNTRKKTKNDMALLSSFMAKEKENRQVEEIPPQELDNYLSRFLLSVRKKNGDEYEPSTLYVAFSHSISHSFAALTRWISM